MQKKLFKISIVIMITLFMLTACSQNKKEESSPPKDDFKKVESSIEKISSSFIDIMKQVDLIPYYEKQISLKKQQEENKTSSKKFTPEPITFTDTLLADILNNEKPQKESEKDLAIPEEIELIWDQIRSLINQVHEQWNDLNPALKKNYISEVAITGFSDSLNLLTQSVTGKKYMETLQNANKATSYLPEFMKESENKALTPLYQAKYLLRQIVLDSTNNNFTKSTTDLVELKEQANLLTSITSQKIGNEESAKLNSSIGELETAIASKDINLIKIKTGIIAKNLTSIKEKI